MSDHDLKRLVDEALAERDRLQPPPAFRASWASAQRAAQARRPAGVAWFRPAVAFAALGAIALAATWQLLGGRGSAPTWTEAADLRLARELSPSRQWPTATDALLRRYDYAPPTHIEVPETDMALKESYL